MKINELHLWLKASPFILPLVRRQGEPNMGDALSHRVALVRLKDATMTCDSRP
jgi:hypothetical protein